MNIEEIRRLTLKVNEKQFQKDHKFAIKQLKKNIWKEAKLGNHCATFTCKSERLRDEVYNFIKNLGFTIDISNRHDGFTITVRWL